LHDRLGKDAVSGDVYSNFIRPLVCVTAFSNGLPLAGDKKCRQADQERQKARADILRITFSPFVKAAVETRSSNRRLEQPSLF
jgi:hypothetical protein